MVWLDSTTLLIGQGYRTNPAGIAQMRALLQPHGVEVLSAPLPYGTGPSACLHLMSLMSLLDEQTVAGGFALAGGRDSRTAAIAGLPVD